MIPTFKRSESLQRCLLGLQNQNRLPDQVIIVCRQEDMATVEMIGRWDTRLPIQQVTVTRPGQVIALNAGLGAVSGDVVAITDDDTIPTPQWLSRIEAHFESDWRVGGVGGRDAVHDQGSVIPQSTGAVGRILPYGRVIGNHHIGSGIARPVDILKGANMSWRMAAIGDVRFDVDLRGAGAQVGNDLAFSLAIRRRGWRIIYDPLVLVDHFPAVRLDSDQRTAPSLEAVENSAFNFYLSVRRYLSGWERRLVLAWAGAVGTDARPGLVRAALLRLRSNSELRITRECTVRAWRNAKEFQSGTQSSF